MIVENRNSEKRCPLSARIRRAFFPDAIVRAPDEIDYRFWAGTGIRAVFLDMDNTLVKHGVRQADAYVKNIVSVIIEIGLTPVIFSNAAMDRFRIFAESVPADFIAHAKKPQTDAALAYLRTHALTPDQVLMVGDQLLTDVLCARRAGMSVVLTERRCRQEIVTVRLKRIAEHLIIWLGGRNEWNALRQIDTSH